MSRYTDHRLNHSHQGIGLEEAGVEFSRHGVTINDTMQTSNPDIYAVGDVASPYQFTHVAGTMAQMVVQNVLFGGDQGKLRTMSDLVIPWVTYTEPEIAHVGITESGAKSKGIELDS
jgi:pyruvate/2-oxoglutarate dehydrogenase complex dihydrolipoamide dehydrogenase (E3) component